MSNSYKGRTYKDIYGREKPKRPVSDFLENFARRLGNFAMDPGRVITGGPSVNEQVNIIRENYPRIKEFTPEFKQEQKEKSKISDPETNILGEGTSDPKRELLSEDQLLDKVNDLYRKNVLQQTAIREFELGREARRNMAAAQQYNQMINLAAENTARRKLMEDTFSPTKISQQRLRAQTGEAALMNAIANQGTSAAQIGNIGTSRRYGR